MTRGEYFAWAMVGALVGMVLGPVVVARVVISLFGAGGLVPDDPTPAACALYIGVPLGGYLGWRLGPGIGLGLARPSRRGKKPGTGTGEEDSETTR